MKFNLNAFPAFKSRNYRLYFSGQLISLTGTWLQIVAEGWLVLQLTNSAFWVGAVAAVATLPSLLFSLFGGVIVDRFPKKKILYFTQSSSMILALIYGLLTVFGFINVPLIMILGFLLGCVTAIDSPARQAYVIELVGRDYLTSAIALNAGMFNTARVIGPSIAGILIALVGSGGAFLLNSLSYIAVLIALSQIKTIDLVQQNHLHPLKAIKEGLVYAYKHPIIKNLLIFMSVISIFGWSYTTMLSVIAKNIFHVDAAGFGYLFAATGFGALTATAIVSAFSQKVSRNVFIFGGNILFTLSLIIFTFVKSYYLALPILFFTGLGLLLQFTTISTTIQHSVDNNIRGRVMSIYSLVFIGFGPIGNFQIGFLAEHLGPEIAIRVGAIIVFLFGIYLFTQRNRIEKAHKIYQLTSVR